jgi:hypothetical protein
MTRPRQTYPPLHSLPPPPDNHCLNTRRNG